jgi:flagellar hook-associated protein 3 FlgL
MIDLAAAATTKNQAAVAHASDELSSGMRVNAPSDDPAAWLAAQRTKLRQALSQGNGAAMASGRDRLVSTDNALASLGDVVSQVRSLAVQGASATYNPANRAGLGDQVRGLFQNALDAANARGNDGEFLLAGSASLTQPFDATGVYHGDATVRSLPGDTTNTTPVTIAGTALTAASGVDVLPLLDRVATALSTNDMATLTAALPDLDAAVKQISSARTTGGSAMNVIDQATSSHAVMEQDMAAAISKFVEVDTVTAAGELAKATQALEVSRTVSQHIVSVLAPST